MRRSSNPKLILGRESAIEGAYAEVSGGRMPLAERDGSNEDNMLNRLLVRDKLDRYFVGGEPGER